MPDAPATEVPGSPAIVAALMPWIRAARRDLPWRRRRDPYAVWVSEIMLQQTQVETVIPYFERWMAQFPDLQALAAAPLEAVLKAWEGLGYYARARNLHRAAQQVVAQYAGRLPSERAALLSLPGIGRYTVGAILSLAFAHPEPVLDGNVRRVLARVYDIAGDIQAPATERQLWALATELVQAAPPGAAGDVNEGLMELGALICTPGKPDCPTCPLQYLCLAHLRGTERERPAKSPRPATPHHAVATAVIRSAQGDYLVAQRLPHGLLGGLWEFPSTAFGVRGTSQAPGEEQTAFLGREIRQRLGIAITVGPLLVEVEHAFTHFRITLRAYQCAPAGTSQHVSPARDAYTEALWLAPGELARYAFPVPQQKILAVLWKRA